MGKYVYIYIFLEENKKGRGIEQPRTVKSELFLSVFDFLDLFYTWRRKMKKTWREKIKSKKKMYIYTYISSLYYKPKYTKEKCKAFGEPLFSKTSNWLKRRK